MMVLRGPVNAPMIAMPTSVKTANPVINFNDVPHGAAKLNVDSIMIS